MTARLIDALSVVAQFLVPALIIAWADRPRAPGDRRGTR